MQRPTASIVIPALNEEKRIGACLDALVKQKTKEPFEVIVVDNGSTDKTSKIARSYSGKLNITVLREERRGRGRARRTGFLKARGKYFLSTDADAIVPPNWIDAFLEYFRKHPKAVGATGLPQIVDCEPQVNKTFNTIIPYIISGNFLMYGHPGMSGFSCAVRADIYKKVGGFDAKTDAYEDLDLSKRVGKLGRIGLIKTPRVTFSGRRFQKGLLRGWFEYMLPFLQMYLLGKNAILAPINESESENAAEEIDQETLTSFRKLLAPFKQTHRRKKKK